MRVKVVDGESAKCIMHDMSPFVDVWKEPRVGHHADIMVSPMDFCKVESILNKTNISYDVIVEDVQNLST